MLLRLVTKINVQQDFNKNLVAHLFFVASDVATEFKWYYDLIRNPRVSFSGHVDSESIQVDETFVDIHAEDDNDNDNDTNDFVQPPSTRPGLDMDPTNMDSLMDDDWATQGFEHLSRRPPRSQMPRFTNRDQLNRGSCFF